MYPEAARLTAMQGAEIIFYPTAIGWLPEEKPRWGTAALRVGNRAARPRRGERVLRLRRQPRGDGRGKRILGGSPSWRTTTAKSSPRPPVSDEAILYAELDLDALEDHRRIWPFFRDRRIDSYGGITERWGKVNL